MSLVESVLSDGIATVTMIDDKRRNALSRALTGELVAALAAMRESEARVVILRAARGTKVWSAGYDIDELDDVTRDALGSSDGIRALVRGIEEFPAPVVALLEGGVYGAACEVAMVCDILIATPEVSFAITPAKLGLMYNVSGVLALLKRMPLGVVKEMAFAAQPVAADRAERLGIVNHVVPAADIEAFTLDLARRIVALAPLSIGAMKAEIAMLSDVVAFSPRAVEGMQQRRRAVFGSADFGEGLAAFREKRPPAFRGT